jgi:hypothetical protein
VFHMDDIPLLGIPPVSPAWGPIVNINTANGVVCTTSDGVDWGEMA